MLIHVTGASGSGVTTLGEALAKELSFTHFDADNYYWLATNPPFQTKRAHNERLELLLRDLAANPNAVLSGSIVGWGHQIENLFALIVFLYLPVSVRLERLHVREFRKYGAVDAAFILWASQYDEGPPEGRSLAKHNAWLASRNCPVLRLERDEPVSQRVDHVLKSIA